MWLKWLPWKFLIRRAARSKGFLDPFLLWAYLRRFAQPSDVGEPIELLRAGVVFHARGLMNSRAIQHNLDWVWPYWVERQFNPTDDAFVPRAFSITHVNLTHRNWTAVGLPDCPALPIVDPRGLVTPLYDGWSLDGWVLAEDGRFLTPSRLPDVKQALKLHEDNISVLTESAMQGLTLASEAQVILEKARPILELRLRAGADARGWLVVALRPYNPEGVSLVHKVEIDADHHAWKVNGHRSVEFSDAIEQHAFSHYRAGDVFHHIPSPQDEHAVTCDVGMATGAFLFEIKPGGQRELTLRVPLEEEARHEASAPRLTPGSWAESLRGACELRVPDSRYQFLYDAAVRTLVLHSPGDVYPGPYTYKRFWFRDAAFILHTMLCVGLEERVRRVLERFPERQTSLGYFHSQEGEWDSNGEALWILHRYCELTGCPPRADWRHMIRMGARWIRKKRTPENNGVLHGGLLPAGFSAEHLGLNDFYYWDDFWGVAGLLAAARMLRALGDQEGAARAQAEADAFLRTIERTLEVAGAKLGRPAIPASPYRRMDAGAIGSLVAGYPLGLFAPQDLRLLDTAYYLVDECFLGGGFFQDMIHSGINPYLSLHVAQVLLRAGDARFDEIMRTVAHLATPTGQWPEAVHPRTKGGCMGDGQHVWAAAEWVQMVRNCFVREEGDDRLILCSGLARSWFEGERELSFGPAPTSFGTLTVRVTPRGDRLRVRWQAHWRAGTPKIEVRPPGYEPALVRPGQDEVELRPPYAGSVESILRS